jgi:hypothetical protein
MALVEKRVQLAHKEKPVREARMVRRVQLEQQGHVVPWVKLVLEVALAIQGMAEIQALKVKLARMALVENRVQLAPQGSRALEVILVSRVKEDCVAMMVRGVIQVRRDLRVLRASEAQWVILVLREHRVKMVQPVLVV